MGAGLLSEARLGAAAECFRQAAIGCGSWEAAVDAYASALDIPHGQLIAFGRDSLVALNISTGEALAELEAFGGHAPDVNSRVRIGIKAPELTFLDESDFTTEADGRANGEYRDWLQRHSVGYSCVSPLLRNEGMLVGLAALRKRHQDAMNDEEKRGFMTIAAEVRSAVTLALALEGQQAKNIAVSIEQMAMATLIFDGAGRLIAMSPKGERAVSRGWLGRLVDGALILHKTLERDRFNSRLGEAILARHSPAIAPPRPTAITTADDERLIAEFVPLPNDSGFMFSAAVMVVLRGLRSGPGRRTGQMARELFGLTDAEEQVAAGLLRGQSPSEIAVATGRTVGTVRNHVHRILSKSDCTSQVEFLGLMAGFD